MGPEWVQPGASNGDRVSAKRYAPVPRLVRPVGCADEPNEEPTGRGYAICASAGHAASCGPVVCSNSCNTSGTSD